MPLEILPSIDLRDGKVVRLKQGDFAQQTSYDVDPFSVAASFVTAGAKFMHIVDLDGTKAGAVRQADLIGRIVRSVAIAVEVGGGVRTEADITALLSAGAARVVIGTAALANWTWFEALVPRFPHQIVLALDGRDGLVATHGWQASSDRRAVDLGKRVTDWPLAGLLYTDIAVDGMLTGPNIERTSELAAASKIPVIASGGVGDIAHIHALKPTGAWGVVVGRALYEGKLNLPEAVRIGRA